MIIAIASLNNVLNQTTERLKTRTAEVDDLMHQLTAKKEELYKERKAHEETKKELKTMKAHIASAVSAAEEGATASGIANRIVIRLMDENERLRNSR